MTPAPASRNSIQPNGGNNSECLPERHSAVIFLEPAELVVLTGYKRPADQARWLERNRIPFTVNRLGRPVVRRDMDKSPLAAPELGPVR